MSLYDLSSVAQVTAHFNNAESGVFLNGKGFSNAIPSSLIAERLSGPVQLGTESLAKPQRGQGHGINE